VQFLRFVREKLRLFEGSKMKLSTHDGNLRLRSAFKLIFTGWLIGWGGMFAFFYLIFFLVALFGGTIDVNGEPMQGLPAVLGLLPFLPFIAIIIFFHAVFFSGLTCLGLLVYRRFKPISVLMPPSSDAGSNAPE